MARVRSLTNKPFGVDLLHALNDNPIEEVRRIIDGGATSFAAGLGVPSRVIGLCHEAGLKVITVTATVKHARMAAEAGCDLIVAQGSEAGGHTGSVGSFALFPQAVDAVSIPVVAAGGIFDGRGLAAALAFGCAGVWVGTRFVASQEARAAEVYKQAIVRASESDTVSPAAGRARRCGPFATRQPKIGNAARRTSNRSRSRPNSWPNAGCWAFSSPRWPNATRHTTVSRPARVAAGSPPCKRAGRSSTNLSPTPRLP